VTNETALPGKFGKEDNLMLGISKFLDILNGEYPFHLNFLPESPDFIIEWFTFAIPKFPTLPANG